MALYHRNKSYDLPGDGWSVGSTPIIIYNYESKNWMIPLQITVGKTFIIGERPWNFSLDLNCYVERPDEIAPKWMVSFNVAPVVENVFAKWFEDCITRGQTYTFYKNVKSVGLTPINTLPLARKSNKR